MNDSAISQYDSVVVLGAGAVGSYVGGMLSRVIPTTLVARGAHGRAMRESGLRLGGQLDDHIEVAVADDLPQLAGRVLVVLSVKTRDLESAARQLAPKASEHTDVLCVQNGLQPQSVVLEALAGSGRSDLRVLRAITSSGCDMAKPGVVDYWGGGVAFPTDEDALAAMNLFSEAGIPVDTTLDINLDVWKKLAVNCIANPLVAILGGRNCDIITPDLEPVRRAVYEEVRACAEDAGVMLPDDFAALADKALANSRNRNSMRQDIGYGRQTEIDDLNGLIAKLSADAGRESPANTTLTRIVRFLEDSASVD